MINLKQSLMIAVSLCLGTFSFAGNPHPAGNRIRTQWADEVSPTNSHPEYPRPQMVRKDWMSLNGLWNYSILPKKSGKPSAYDGRILVPFAVESSLSGVCRKVGDNDALWYETCFKVPSGWNGKRLRLNFEAVDWKAEVYVNDVLVGIHTGGYAPFSFDITSVLKKGKEQKLVLKVTDATNHSFQPHGKQVLDPNGIWYTAVTGIWQSVWLEPVNRGSVRSYYAVSDIDSNRMDIMIDEDDAKDGDMVQVELFEGGIGYSPEKGPEGMHIAQVKAVCGSPVSLTVPGMHPWSPEDPYLYGLRISILRNGKLIDRVDGYAAMRKISVVKDSLGHKRIGLNNRPLFQLGPLDQGWWPDGLYTAPTDEALKYDLVKTRDFGYNMIRKHVKVEPSRWYFYCDQLGLMVWQDMPSIADNSKNKWGTSRYGEGTDYPVSDAGKANYYKEWGEIINARKFFQCIVVWVPFNEAWGQFDTRKVVDFTRKQDGTRLIDPASGGNYEECGDIVDIHHYPEPKMLLWNEGYVNVLGEFGGIGLPVEGHLWQSDKNWGYVKYQSGKEVTDKYESFADMLIGLIDEGCSAAVYTQTTDVEGEVNGLMTYDRKVTKQDESRLRSINKRIIGSLK